MTNDISYLPDIRHVIFRPPSDCTLIKSLCWVWLRLTTPFEEKQWFCKKTFHGSIEGVIFLLSATLKFFFSLLLWEIVRASVTRYLKTISQRIASPGP